MICDGKQKVGIYSDFSVWHSFRLSLTFLLTLSSVAHIPAHVIAHCFSVPSGAKRSSLKSLAALSVHHECRYNPFKHPTCAADTSWVCVPSSLLQSAPPPLLRRTVPSMSRSCSCLPFGYVYRLQLTKPMIPLKRGL